MIKLSNRVRCAIACFAVDWWKQHPLFKAGYDAGLHDAELEADSEEAYERGKKAPALSHLGPVLARDKITGKLI